MPKSIFLIGHHYKMDCWQHTSNYKVSYHSLYCECSYIQNFRSLEKAILYARRLPNVKSMGWAGRPGEASRRKTNVHVQRAAQQGHKPGSEEKCDPRWWITLNILCLYCTLHITKVSRWSTHSWNIDQHKCVQMLHVDPQSCSLPTPSKWEKIVLAAPLTASRSTSKSTCISLLPKANFRRHLS